MSRANERCAAQSRRRMLASTLRLAAFGAVSAFVPGAMRGARAQTAAPGGPAAEPEAPTGTRLVLLGVRGGPGVELDRSQTASAVVVDGATYLVDCGYGTLRSLVAAGLRYNRIGTVFLTHLHNDHTSDLTAFLSHQWTGSRSMPTDVYGPYGTRALVDAANLFMDADADIRIVDEGRETRPEALFHGHDVPAASKPAEVFEDERVHVTAIENNHYSDRAKARMQHRSLAFRFETRERSIVFSGDTPYSPNLVKLARGVDLFVCEVMAQDTYERMLARAKADAEAGHRNSISRHVAETHSTPRDVGRMAAEAGVKTVVLNHQLVGDRPDDLEFPVTRFIDGVREEFAGEIIVGRDLMVL